MLTSVKRKTSPGWIGRACAAWCLLSLVQACQRASTDETGKTPPTVLTFDGKPYQLDELMFFIDEQYPEIRDTLDNELFSKCLDDFKREISLGELATSAGHFVTEDQVGTFIEKRITTMSFHLLSPKKQDLWRRAIKRRLAIRDLLRECLQAQINTPEEDIHRYYQDHQRDFQEETLYQIRLFQSPEEKSAQDFLEALKKSKEPFAKVAEDFQGERDHHSAVPLPLEDLPVPFQQALSRMGPGQHSKVIPLQQGKNTAYFVVYLEAIIPENQLPFEEAYHGIRTRLLGKAASGLLEDRLRQFQAKKPLIVYHTALPYTYIKPEKRSDRP